jgi:hypothetical protein
MGMINETPNNPKSNDFFFCLSFGSKYPDKSKLKAARPNKDIMKRYVLAK